MEARPMRADARRNLEQILRAARDMIAERGPDVPLDDIARRAKVGSATLYRRFPDRDRLLRAVALDALTSTATAAAAAAEQEDDPFEALARYLRDALELRVSAVLPAMIDVVDLDADPELSAARETSARLVRRLVDDARAAGALPEDVTFMDVGTMLVRIARPLPGPLDADEKHAFARRHLELFIRGLRATGGARHPLPSGTMDG
ncbi:TetR/AcrR family transcriptional regulator [Nonomuraea sp. SMC257]|uniref:TetR/AcrR family transcriptional regulator n=1 Tax=Nonomuraea montanisoli TaxID=2741721 RepID=A0A7Y6I580_9ACTN|nr:TetR/AcrR family transcriptional regulator [Nonomuraea montanisoli]NUW31935.1 TetR/AcrR family transcriptional regulator [Nonomuraea montanisoli]